MLKWLQSKRVQYALCVVFFVALLIFCRVMDHHYQTQSEDFPIESCVTVDLVHGEIDYVLSTRCLLVVKAFKAGRESTTLLKSH